VAGTDFEPTATGMLTLALKRIDPAAGEHQTTQILAAALDRQDYRIASAAARNLVVDCTRAGRFGEALELAEQTIGYTRRAGLGQWTQLLDEVRRLQVLKHMGQHGKALAEVRRLPECEVRRNVRTAGGRW
jgi:PAS domain-containing protein